jgi:hypothetical protein
VGMAVMRGWPSTPVVGGLTGDWRFHAMTGAMEDGEEDRGAIDVDGAWLAFGAECRLDEPVRLRLGAVVLKGARCTPHPTIKTMAAPAAAHVVVRIFISSRTALRRISNVIPSSHGY